MDSSKCSTGRASTPGLYHEGFADGLVPMIFLKPSNFESSIAGRNDDGGHFAVRQSGSPTPVTSVKAWTSLKTFFSNNCPHARCSLPLWEFCFSIFDFIR